MTQLHPSGLHSQSPVPASSSPSRTPPITTRSEASALQWASRAGQRPCCWLQAPAGEERPCWSRSLRRGTGHGQAW